MNYLVNLVCCTIIIFGATNGGLLPESSHTQRPSSKGPLGSPSADLNRGWSTESNNVEISGDSSATNEGYKYGDYQLQYQQENKAEIEAQAKAESELALWKAKEDAAVALEKDKVAKKAATESEKELAKAHSYFGFLKAKNTALTTPFTGVNAELNKAYLGPLAMVRVLPTGFIADTPEVTAARANHLAAVASVKSSEEEAKAQAQAEIALWKAKEAAVIAQAKAEATALWKAENAAMWRAKHAEEFSAKVASAKVEVEQAKNILSYLSYTSTNLNQPWFGPLAMLQVLPDGFLADTADVAAAKKSHLRVVASAEAADAQAKAKEQEDIALWRAKEQEDIALWRAKEQEDIALWRAKEQEVIALWRAKEAELKILAKHEADAAAWKGKKEEAKMEAWKAKQEWN